MISPCWFSHLDTRRLMLIKGLARPNKTTRTSDVENGELLFFFPLYLHRSTVHCRFPKRNRRKRLSGLLSQSAQALTGDLITAP
jgi:hypothetical protein